MKAALLLAAAAVLASACASPTSAGTTGDENDVIDSPELAHWTKVALAAGAKVNRNGEATVIGVRGRASDDTLHTTQSHRAFDDLVVIIRPDHSIVKLPFSTHPFETKGVPGVPDVDGDGVQDVGMIRPGLYRAIGRGTTRLVGGHAAYDVTTAAGSGKLPGIRDTDHDGVFGDAEDAASKKRGDTVTAVLFHHADGGAPAAVGCQVFEEANIVKLIAAVGGPKASFDYVLVSAEDSEAE